MYDRPSVSCGHCHRPGAGGLCPTCNQPICPTCLSADTCPALLPRCIQLGWGVRLRAVDEAGRLGYVTRKLGNPGVLDLEADRAVATLPERAQQVVFTHTGPSAFAKEHLAWLALRHTAPRTPPEPGLLLVDTRQGYYSYPEFLPLSRRDGQQLALTDDGHYAVVGYHTQVEVVDLWARRAPGSLRTCDQPVHALAVSGGLDLLAIGTASEVRCFRLGSLRDLGVKSVSEGAVWALALAADRMVAISEGGMIDVMELHRGRPPHRWPRFQRLQLDVWGRLWPAEVSLSADGRLLAVRRKRKQVVVYLLDADEEQRLAHADRVELVRFVRQGQMLVTADKHHRVIFWPRIGDRIVAVGGE
jgi:hypothetical protein